MLIIIQKVYEQVYDNLNKMFITLNNIPYVKEITFFSSKNKT